MRISDWSSDVCSSDLARRAAAGGAGRRRAEPEEQEELLSMVADAHSLADLKTALGDTTPVEAEAAPREPKIDAQGRSYGTGRRKNAIARVWIKPGSGRIRSEEHTSELQSLMRISYAVFRL